VRGLNMSKTMPVMFAVSLALHALVGAPRYLSLPRSQDAHEEEIQISYVIPPPVNAEPEHAPKAKNKGIKPEEALVLRPAATHPRAERQVKQKPRALPAISTSTELLSNPETGKIFSGYFNTIKKKIHHRVLSKYSHHSVGQGSVSLFFILDSNGKMDSVSVIERQSEADQAVKDFATECLKEASPFPPFPTALDLRKISFSVTLMFEDL